MPRAARLTAIAIAFVLLMPALGERLLYEPVRLIWTDPGSVESMDLALGSGGDHPPRPPYTFIKENLSGSSPKATVRDASGRVWRVKFGNEVHADVFGSRMAWACGYPADASYFVPFGHIEGVRNPRRIASHLHHGHFLNARFALNEESVRLLESESWTWMDNPFAGTRELNGLKILIMLLSNWDNKDGRDRGRGSNTLVLERDLHGRRQWLYAMTDWGASMGKWGGVASREKWDCRLFEKQTPELVRGVAADGAIEWGYRGQHTDTFVHGIAVDDVRWLMRRLGRISDRQIRAALEASGATRAECDCFAEALRRRIARLAAL